MCSKLQEVGKKLEEKHVDSYSLEKFNALAHFLKHNSYDISLIICPILERVKVVQKTKKDHRKHNPSRYALHQVNV